MVNRSVDARPTPGRQKRHCVLKLRDVHDNCVQEAPRRPRNSHIEYRSHDCHVDQVTATELGSKLLSLTRGARPGPVEAARRRGGSTPARGALEARPTLYNASRARYGTGVVRVSKGARAARRLCSSAGLHPNVKAPNRLKSSDCRPNIDQTFANASSDLQATCYVYELCDLKIRHWKIAELRAGFGALRTSADP